VSLRFNLNEARDFEEESSSKIVDSYNPWNRRLDSPEIQIILGHVCEVVMDLQEGSFDGIIHDSPLSGKTDALYGREFYARLYITSERRSSILLVGSPRRLRGVDLIKMWRAG
jgi:predicted methyltransferase